MVFTVHAGHNPDGKFACGAVGLIKESTEARKVKDLVIKKLTLLGHKCYDCTEDNGASQSDIVTKIKTRCNRYERDYDISIHFNSGAKDAKGNGATTGVEVLVYSKASKAYAMAENVAAAISALGYKNRGVKIRTDIGVLKTNKPAMLIECCFVDDADDVKKYDADTMASAIVKGITGMSVSAPVKETSTSFIVQCLDDLNIRKTPGGEVKTVNGCKKGQKYTITKVSGTWGFLKSGAGWISISDKYVKRL